MTQYLLIDGYCQPAERPRLGNGCVFTPKRTSDYIRLVRKEAWNQRIMKVDGPVALVIKVVSKRPICRQGERWKTTKGDVDNLLKSLMDGLTSVAYDDDKQVVSTHIQKEYGDQDYTYIEIIDLCEEDAMETYLESIRSLLRR